MAQKKELVQFSVQNNTDCDINVPLLQRNIYSINATTKYSWNIQTIDLSCGSGSIVVNGGTYPLSYIANSLVSFLSALNNLGFGFFCTELISSVNYLYTQDDTNVYGTINDCASGSTTTTTTTTTTAAPTTSTTTTTTTAAPTTSTTTTTTTEAPTTSTTTTTTTEAPTTSTTTTTTTAAPFNFNLSNTSLDVSVTQLDYNGTTASVTAGTMPNIPSANTQLLQNEVGSFDVVITYNSSLGGQHITITDSNGTISCQGTSVGTGLTLTYPTIVWDGSTPIQVDILDGAC